MSKTLAQVESRSVREEGGGSQAVSLSASSSIVIPMALAILLATGKLGILFLANIMLTWLLFTPATVAMEEMEGVGEIGGAPLPFPTFAVDMVVVMVAVVAVIKLRRGYLLGLRS